MKFALWILVILAVLVGLRLLNVGKARRRTDAGRGAGRHASDDGTMVRCVRCGVFLPRAEAKPAPEGMTCGDPGCRSAH
jgi:hypothetical protein